MNQQQKNFIQFRANHFYVYSQNYVKKLLAPSCLSVCLSARPQPTWNNSAPTGQIFMKYDI